MTTNRIQPLGQNRFAAFADFASITGHSQPAPVAPVSGYVMVPLGLFGFVNPFAMAFFAAQAQLWARWQAAQAAQHQQAQAAIAARQQENLVSWQRDWADYFDTDDENFWQWN